MVTGCARTNLMALVSCFKYICCKGSGASIYKAGAIPADSSFWRHGKLFFRTVAIRAQFMELSRKQVLVLSQV